MSFLSLRLLESAYKYGHMLYLKAILLLATKIWQRLSGKMIIIAIIRPYFLSIDVYCHHHVVLFKLMVPISHHNDRYSITIMVLLWIVMMNSYHLKSLGIYLKLETAMTQNRDRS